MLTEASGIRYPRIAVTHRLLCAELLGTEHGSSQEQQMLSATELSLLTSCWNFLEMSFVI